MATVGVKHHEMFIDGQDVGSDDLYEIENPATGELVATMAKGSVDHADQAVESAKRAFESGVWSDLGPDERAPILREVSERLAADTEELVEAEISCNGATMRQALGFHVGLASQHFLYFAELAAKYEFKRAVATPAYPTLSSNFIQREPIGVCAGIVPWNFPLLLGLWKIAPALAAGNSIVIKPDEKTPLSLLALCKICHECGVPDGVFNLVSGDGEDVGARLSSHPDVGKVAFTGSTAVGREIMKLASGTVKKVSLELGGKAPAVALEDVDQRLLADGALWGSMLYSGQICESATRLLLPDSIHDEVVERIVARAKTIKLGDIYDLDTDLGPVVSKEQHDRVLGYIEKGKEDGATLAVGGGVPEGFDKGYWVEPTVFCDVTNDMRIAREEIFGPVLSIIRYDGLKEALEIANDTEYGLSAAVWTTDYEKGLEVADKLRAGTVWINDTHALTPEAPFGGYKQSGVGRELGPDALAEYTETKHIHVDMSQHLDRRPYDVLLSEPPADE